MTDQARSCKPRSAPSSAPPSGLGEGGQLFDRAFADDVIWMRLASIVIRELDPHLAAEGIQVQHDWAEDVLSGLLPEIDRALLKDGER